MVGNLLEEFEYISAWSVNLLHVIRMLGVLIGLVEEYEGNFSAQKNTSCCILIPKVLANISRYFIFSPSQPFVINNECFRRVKS